MTALLEPVFILFTALVWSTTAAWTSLLVIMLLAFLIAAAKDQSGTEE